MLDRISFKSIHHDDIDKKSTYLYAPVLVLILKTTNLLAPMQLLAVSYLIKIQLVFSTLDIPFKPFEIHTKH